MTVPSSSERTYQYRCVDPAYPHPADAVWHDEEADAVEECAAFHGLGAYGYHVERREVGPDA